MKRKYIYLKYTSLHEETRKLLAYIQFFFILINLKLNSWIFLQKANQVFAKYFFTSKACWSNILRGSFSFFYKRIVFWYSVNFCSIRQQADSTQKWSHSIVPVRRRRRPLSFVPETNLLLGHVVWEQVALATCLDAAAVRHRRVLALTLALAVFQTARIPTDAELKVTLAWRPYLLHQWAAVDVVGVCISSMHLVCQTGISHRWETF